MENTTALTTRIDESLYTELKIQSAKEGKSIKDIVSESISNYLKSKGVNINA